MTLASFKTSEATVGRFFVGVCARLLVASRPFICSLRKKQPEVVVCLSVSPPSSEEGQLTVELKNDLNHSVKPDKPNQKGDTNVTGELICREIKRATVDGTDLCGIQRRESF
ncbi:hypothetical protein PAMP_024830 [Pampus punctatissimus]